MSEKIIGVTVGTQLPKPDFNQTDPTKGDYIKNKPAAVLYTEQTLTDEQKVQARTNIGVLEPLIGTTAEITPSQVLEAIEIGRDVLITHTDAAYGVIRYSAFMSAPAFNAVMSSDIVLYAGAYGLLELYGNTQKNTWNLLVTQLAEYSDIPTALKNPNALTFTGAVTGSYDGSQSLTIEIPENKSEIFYVDITCSGDVSSKESYSTDVTMEELSAAYNAGRPIYARVNSFFFSLIDGYDETSFSLVFCGVSIGFLNNIDDNKYVCSSISPVRIANPNALTINGTTYDGSEAVEIDVGAMTVNFSMAEDETMVADKSLSEIIEAYQSGRQVNGVYITNEGDYYVLECKYAIENSGVAFTGVSVTDNAKALTAVVAFYDDGSTTIEYDFTNLLASEFVVNITSNDDMSEGIADHTFYEVKSALDAGRPVRCMLDGLELPMLEDYDPTMIGFAGSYCDDNYLIQLEVIFDVHSDNNVTVSADICQASGGLIVTVTKSGDEYTADHTVQEIIEAAENGQVIAVVEGFRLPLMAVSTERNSAEFMYTILSEGAAVTLVLQISDTVVFEQIIPSAKNPNELTITQGSNITVYDGSLPITLDVSQAPLVVTATKNPNGKATLDKTLGALGTAHGSNRDIIFKYCYNPENPSYFVYLSIVLEGTLNGVPLLTFQGTCNGVRYETSFICSGLAKTVTINEIPVEQTLTINGVSYDGSKSVDMTIDAVLYTAQALTDEQKLQARENIGVNYTIDDALAILAETNTAVPVQDEDGNILTDENGNVIIL